MNNVATTDGNHHSLRHDQTHQRSATTAKTLRVVSRLPKIEPMVAWASSDLAVVPHIIVA